MNSVKIAFSLILTAFLVFAPAVASAQEGKVMQNLDLGSESLEGQLLGPDQGFMSARKISIMNSLIQFRDDFIVEMIKSAEDL